MGSITIRQNYNSLDIFVIWPPLTCAWILFTQRILPSPQIVPATLKKQQQARPAATGRMSGDARGPREYGNRDRDNYRRGPASGGPDKAADAGAGAASMEFVSSRIAPSHR